MAENKKQQKVLWACWEKPDTLPANGAVVLSFLKPGAEVTFKESWRGTFVSARKEAAGVKERALAAYIGSIGQLGAVSSSEGMTFRKALQTSEEVSLWWFHPVSLKYCEGDPVFNQMIQTLTINQVARAHQCGHIVICGGPYEIVEVLRTRFSVTARRCHRRMPLVSDYFLPFLRRMKFCLQSLYELLCLRRCDLGTKGGADILFSGSWDWSVKESSPGRLWDRYYQAVPEKLEARGINVGWLAWFQQGIDPSRARRSIAEAAKPLQKYPQVIIVQSFVGFGEIIRAVCDFRPFVIFLRYARQSAFRANFDREGFNFLPLFQGFLRAGFLDSSIPRYTLVYVAHKKAAARYHPKVVVSFLDFFPYARAVNAGVKQGSPRTILVDIQHASYSREKTFGVLDARHEYQGIPDDCAIPRPDYICAMGELGRDIFMEGGFSSEHVLLTGSSRYDSASLVDEAAPRKKASGKNVLIVTTLQKMGPELEMIDAVCAAFERFPEISLHLRSHPFFDITTSAGFRPFKDKVKSTGRTSLEEDLSKADVVIFSYSAAAEEAFLRGIPVWQWISAGYNASVFRDLPIVPAFSSVEELVRLYMRFLENPNEFVPTQEQRQLVKQKCFYAGSNGVPSDHITELLSSWCADPWEGLVLSGHQEGR